MPENTSLDTAIPPIGWREPPPDAEPNARRKRKQEKAPRSKAPSNGSTPPRTEESGTTIDVTA